MLVIDELTVRIAGRPLLESASARIPTGARVGLVGRNGTGKTTLFGVIAGDISPEHGSVTISPRWRIGRLAQEAPNGPESLIEVVLQADSERTRLMAEAEIARDPHRIAEIQTRTLRYQRAFGACPRGFDPVRAGFLHCRSTASLRGIFRWLAHARGTCCDLVCQAGPAPA